MDRARHRSSLLLAFERGYLYRITSPVHRYLIKDGEPKYELTEQYRQDLREHWLLEKTENDRHKKFRMFMGKLSELLCAGWIEKQGWRITSLKALGGNTDIEAISPDKIECGIEVKYIGLEDDVFKAVVERFSGGCGVGTSSPYTAANYVLFRAYEAAKQLQGRAKTCFAFLVIDEITWDDLNPLIENLIQWKSPSFFNNDPKWQNFLQQKKKYYPDIEKDLSVTLGSLAELWIVKMKGGFQLSKENVVPFGGRT